MMRKLFLSILIFYSIGITAQTKLPSFFADNMVLQQNREVLIWGTDKPGTIINISASWGMEVSTKTHKMESGLQKLKP